MTPIHISIFLTLVVAAVVLFSVFVTHAGKTSDEQTQADFDDPLTDGIDVHDLIHRAETDERNAVWHAEGMREREEYRHEIMRLLVDLDYTVEMLKVHVRADTRKVKSQITDDLQRIQRKRVELSSHCQEMESSPTSEWPDVVHRLDDDVAELRTLIQRAENHAR